MRFAPVRWLAAFTFVAALSPSMPLLAQERPTTTWNRSADPDAPEGHCQAQAQASAFGPKWVLVNDVGESTDNVLAVEVLRCVRFSGGGLSKVDCAAFGANGVPYAYCARALNDGLGNDITIGVLRRDATTDANGAYTGCPAGATARPKLEVLQDAGSVDPRRLNGIVTISCAAATGAPARARDVACPPEPMPYSRCIGTTNDGHGNAVTLGLVPANGPGDPYGLYGNCDSIPPISVGMHYKADALAAAGVSIAGVRTMDLAYCAMGPAEAFHTMRCEDIATFPEVMSARLDYCVVGSDDHGNHVVFGVSGK